MELDASNIPQGCYGIGISVDNVNEALPLGLDLIKSHGMPFHSRGMDTLEVLGPVTTVYQHPLRRVLFDPVRDANPFFHMAESLWILSGSDRVDLPKYFLSSIDRFSDDGATMHGAYGHRLRSAFGFDQIEVVVGLLRDNPNTRQAVMSIWSPQYDCGTTTSKDIPCNDMIMFSLRNGLLHMTVCNRSNDVIWGAYGANAVQFSYLHEYVAIAVGAEVGYYVQQSNSFHVYPSNPFWGEYLAGRHAPGHVHNPYMDPEVQPYPLATGPEDLHQFYLDCINLEDTACGPFDDLSGLGEWGSTYFRNVVDPMLRSFYLYKQGNHLAAITALTDMKAVDWQLAMAAWIERRMERNIIKGLRK